MRVLCAPDSFKESMSSRVAAQAMAAGVRRVLPDAECDLAPMADGGEGTTDVVMEALGGDIVPVRCHDALGREIAGTYGWVAERRLAVIDVAAAIGLEHINPALRDVGLASSFGAGELIADALGRGAKRIIIGLGGSATNDAGAGLWSALGVRFLDAAGSELPRGGVRLGQLASVDLSDIHPRVSRCRFEVACDVDNPLLGPDGASAVFGPQKGAGQVMVTLLDGALRRWADVVEPATGRAVRDVPGAGAAGGIGASLIAFADATLRRGAETVADLLDMSNRVASADLVLTGEGAIDGQTHRGKAPWGVAEVALRHGRPVIMFGGSVSPEARSLVDRGVAGLVPIVRSVGDLADALAGGPENLAAAVETSLRLVLVGRRAARTAGDP